MVELPRRRFASWIHLWMTSTSFWRTERTEGGSRSLEDLERRKYQYAKNLSKISIVIKFSWLFGSWIEFPAHLMWKVFTCHDIIHVSYLRSRWWAPPSIMNATTVSDISDTPSDVEGVYMSWHHPCILPEIQVMSSPFNHECHHSLRYIRHPIWCGRCLHVMTSSMYPTWDPGDELPLQSWMPPQSDISDTPSDVEGVYMSWHHPCILPEIQVMSSPFNHECHHSLRYIRHPIWCGRCLHVMTSSMYPTWDPGDELPLQSWMPPQSDISDTPSDVEGVYMSWHHPCILPEIQVMSSPFNHECHHSLIYQTPHLMWKVFTCHDIIHVSYLRSRWWAPPSIMNATTVSDISDTPSDVEGVYMSWHHPCILPEIQVMSSPFNHKCHHSLIYQTPHLMWKVFTCHDIIHVSYLRSRWCPPPPPPFNHECHHSLRYIRHLLWCGRCLHVMTSSMYPTWDPGDELPLQSWTPPQSLIYQTPPLMWKVFTCHDIIHVSYLRSRWWAPPSIMNATVSDTSDTSSDVEGVYMSWHHPCILPEIQVMSSPFNHECHHCLRYIRQHLESRNK